MADHPSGSVLRELADRIVAEGPGTALDADIASAFRSAPELYTSSIDAAALLVPPGLRWILTVDGSHSDAEVEFNDAGTPAYAAAKTPAASLAAAALRARIELGLYSHG